MSSATNPPVDPQYEALIRSERVSPSLRAELSKRAEPDDPDYCPRSLSAGQFETLRAFLDRVVPQDGPVRIDLAARLDAMMTQATGNGWRYEALPGDPDAYDRGLDTLDAIAVAGNGARFADLDGENRDRIVTGLAAQRPFDAPGARLDPAQMALWFEEVRSDAARIFVAHPATMARLGYSGIANGGAAGAAFAGFERIGIGEREAFEPRTREEIEREASAERAA